MKGYIHIDDVYRLIAGHSNYHGDNILTALTCIAEGKNVTKPITPLEQNPCENAISRQAVLNTLEKMDKALDTDRTVESYKELLAECYKVLPSVISKKNTGKWIGDKCSKCGNERAWYGNNPLFCPDCGAKMIEPQESENNE